MSVQKGPISFPKTSQLIGLSENIFEWDVEELLSGLLPYVHTVKQGWLQHTVVNRLTHIMPIFPPIILCSSAPSLSYYSFPVATYYMYAYIMLTFLAIVVDSYKNS